MAPENPPQLAQSLQEISQRTSLIVREEIELARTEVTLKVKALARGAAVGAAAGVFLVVGLLFVLHALAYLLGDYVFSDHITWGYFVVAVVLFLLAALAGLLARRWLKGGSPPVPEMAIDEAKRVRETIASKGERP